MFKKTITYLLIWAVTMQTINRYMMVVDYYVNNTSYIKYCVNKNKPLLHCNGKCFLMKKLRQLESKEKQNNSRRNEHKFEIIVGKILYTKITFNTISEAARYPFLIAKTPTDVSFRFFQPPRAS